MHNIQDQACAMLAAYHCALGVAAVAEKGQWPEENFRTVLPSLSRFNLEHSLDYYDNLPAFAPAREAMAEAFLHGTPNNELRYLMQMLSVERRLAKQPALLETLRTGLNQAARQAEHFGLLHDNTFAKYADVYQQTASVAARKILVRGNPRYLQNPAAAAQVRTLLLCGIRAAGLWRAAGGSRMQIMFGRKALVDGAMQLALD